MGSLGFPEILIILLVAIVGIGGTGFWIFMLIDCATKEAETGNTKVVWIIILIFTHVIGAALYYFVRRPARIRELGR
jgi:Phospholipase_D-nuclease N-terminal